MFTRWQYIAVTAAITSAVVVPATISVAQDGQRPGCSGEIAGLWPATGFGNNATASIYATREGRPTQRTIDSVVPAGTYLVNAVSYDGYLDRTYTTPEQDFEQYVLEFLDADGNVLATSLPTSDLEGGVEEAFWAGPVGQVTLGADAVAVRANHLYAGQPIGTQSVMPSCFGVTAVQVPTTTEPPTTVTEPPTTVTGPPTTVIESPTTLRPAPPSTIPTRVLPRVQQIPDPAPVVATPNFTG